MRDEQPAYLDYECGSFGVRFAEGFSEVRPLCRHLKDARYAFCDMAAQGMEDLYYMYRDVARPKDRSAIEKHGLRYDVTLIPPGLVGLEYNKTVGHYHPVKVGTAYTYPEVYEVLHGEATYLLQQPGLNRGEVEDVVVVFARVGDKVVIPPGYGHITINAGQQPLLMANWVSADFDSVYGEIRELRGGARYLVNIAGTPHWVENPRYVHRVAMRLEQVREYPELGLFRTESMYRLIENTPDRLRFLTHPEEFNWLLIETGRREVAATIINS